MSIRIGINGFGRMGRLALRAAWGWPDLEFVHINDPAGDAATLAHLLNFDSVHGRWSHEAGTENNTIVVAGQRLTTSRNSRIEDSDWSGCDLVIEASGKMKTVEVLQAYLAQGVSRVVVTAPVKEPGVLNVVMGVNDHLYDPHIHRIVTAASCTTNCLAPVVKVIHENLGIRHGSMTTIHDLTNTQTILDAPHKDLRRARACGMSLIPTSTGSATAITGIFPELKGRLNGHAVRVPLANASLTDCVFEVQRSTTVDEVNGMLKAAAESGPLKDILGYEERPLVSIDYKTDPRSSIIDALSTMVVNGTQVKIYAWYDNEWAYANRTMELAVKIGAPRSRRMINLRQLAPEIRQYLVVTGNYWAFTLTDGALRMLVVLHFHGLGYSPLEIALLFLFYEVFGVITNLLGGWLGAHLGLNRTMSIGLALQVIALAMLLVPAALLTVPWVMAAQALSGIAKDLNKMSAKSSIKLLVPAGEQGLLFKWVAILTGSKNALKGAGFFLGGVLLTGLGFAGAVAAMAVALALVWLASLVLLKRDLGKAKNKPRFRDIFSKSRAINILSAARMLLFGARDVWFVVALPVFLAQTLGWNHSQTGGFLALWIIGYGAVQAVAPRLTGSAGGSVPDGRSATAWAARLAIVPGVLALLLGAEIDPAPVVIFGLLLFGAVFAINSSLHSYLIVSYAGRDGVSLDVGFYYMANALGRLAGTVLSGWVFQLAGQGVAGLAACLWISAGMLLATVIISLGLPANKAGP